MAILEISVVPVGTSSASRTAHLAGVVPLLAAAELEYRILPMGSVIQGPLQQLLELARRLHESDFARGAQRVMTHISIDDRRDIERPMQAKVDRLAAAGQGSPS